MPKKRYKAGFYWIKCRQGGRWEVAEYDGVSWNAGPPDGGEIFLIGDRIPEPQGSGEKALR